MDLIGPGHLQSSSCETVNSTPGERHEQVDHDRWCSSDVSGWCCLCIAARLADHQEWQLPVWIFQLRELLQAGFECPLCSAQERQLPLGVFQLGEVLPGQLQQFQDRDPEDRLLSERLFEFGQLLPLQVILGASPARAFAAASTPDQRQEQQQGQWCEAGATRRDRGLTAAARRARVNDFGLSNGAHL